MVFVKCNRTTIGVFMTAPMVTCGDQVTRLRRRVTLGTLWDGIEGSYWSRAAAQVCYGKPLRWSPPLIILIDTRSQLRLSNISNLKIEFKCQGSYRLQYQTCQRL